MRRANRLYRLVELLRSRSSCTGAWLAGQLQISLRTLYRDIADLSLSGVPIEGEAGVGYRLRHNVTLPPLSFDSDEIEALLIGTRMVQAWADPDLERAAQAAMAKIQNVLPAAGRREAEMARLFVPSYRRERPTWLHDIRLAVRHRHIIRIDYVREDGAPSQRELWPLGLFFWGPTWTLIGWCELRNDFRHFRVDRVQSVSVQTRHFPDQKGRRLEDFYAQIEQREGIDVKDRKRLA
ncbi:YafY family protein [Viridibacterium curvum]|uniref:YafY family protein n=1 Tax=Viridibacterium curvum TaxID=1101404 RepID=A0ABP9QPR5_9RHOO